MSKISLSPEGREILRILKRNMISSLWHFTDIRNLPLIKKLDGLRSKQYLEQNGYLATVHCGGDERSHSLDRQLGNWDKISLNFTPHTPMAYGRKKDNHLVFIEIKPVVAAFSGVYFTDRNAARMRNGQLRDKGIAGLRAVNFSYINSPPKPYDKDWVKYVQAEALIPAHIPLRYFKKIHFISSASLELGVYLWGEKGEFFAVTPKVFSDYTHERGWTILNPYVETVTVTHQTVTKENVGSDHKEAEEIQKGQTFWIKVALSATAGTHAKVILKYPDNRILEEVEIEFKEESKWWWYPDFTIPTNYAHPYLIVEIYMDHLLWFKLRRKVS